MAVLNASSRLMSENSRQYAYRILRHNIMTMNLYPGCPINESEISEVLSISRTPIREALFQLKEERLVDVYPQRASYVSLIDLDLAEEGFFLREVTESAVVRLACNHLDLLTISKFRENIELQRLTVNEDNDNRRFLSLDNAFHALIYQTAKKSWTWETVNHITTHYDRIRYIDGKKGNLHLKKIFLQHQEIFNFLLTGESADIPSMMHDHMTGYRTDLPRLLVEYNSYFKQHP